MALAPNNIEEQNVSHETEYSLWIRFKNLLKRNFDLNVDKENDKRTIEVIKADVDMRGSKIWILVFAILIASLGLNINSTAVIIGAMLISPLMGPIMGFGLGLGISDFELIKRSVKNLAETALFSVLTATIYFLVTPLSQAQSELLARTNPTVFDVGIAFVGGLAGIIASSSKSKGNVLPGVAIATALMPPLCTAGYGLATWNLSYFWGALYLFIINSVFIALATFIMVRAMKFPRTTFVDKAREKKISKIIFTIGLATILPSIYFGFLLIQESIVKDSAIRFISSHFENQETQVIKQNIIKIDGRYEVELVLLGHEFKQHELDSIIALRGEVLKDVSFHIRQGLGDTSNDEASVSTLKTLVLQDFYSKSDSIVKAQNQIIQELRNELDAYSYEAKLDEQIERESRAIFDKIQSSRVIPDYRAQRDSASTRPLSVLFEVKSSLRGEEDQRLRSWLKQKLGRDSVRVIYSQVKQ